MSLKIRASGSVPPVQKILALAPLHQGCPCPATQIAATPGETGACNSVRLLPAAALTLLWRRSNLRRRAHCIELCLLLVAQ